MASLIVYGVLMAMGIVGPDLVQSAFLVVMLGAGLFSIAYLAFKFIWNIIWHRRLPSTQSNAKSEGSGSEGSDRWP